MIPATQVILGYISKPVVEKTAGKKAACKHGKADSKLTKRRSSPEAAPRSSPSPAMITARLEIQSLTRV